MYITVVFWKNKIHIHLTKNQIVVNDLILLTGEENHEQSQG